MNEHNNNRGNKGGSHRPRINNYKKTYKPKKTHESLDDLIDRRNQRLDEFFKLLNLPIRTIGNKNHPAFVYEEKYILNAYVHNFELRFTDNCNQGNVVYMVKLTEKPLFDKNKIMSCIENYDKREVKKISLSNTIGNPKLYLSGYNFLNKKEKLGRYPVFSAYIPKVYFTEENAESVLSELIGDGYSVELE